MTVNNHIKSIYLILLTIVCLVSCTEEFIPQTETFESILVVEATLTDELKTQNVFLSRTFRFEDQEPQGEENAAVKITDDLQNEYVFNETEPGKYISEIKFQALPERQYILSVKTKDNALYTSSSVALPKKTSIDRLYAQKTINDKGVEGLGIFVDSSGPENEISYYRYKFEETYRFTAPEFFDLDLVVLSVNPFVTETTTRPVDKKVCYKTDFSNDLILASTEDLVENKLQKFLIRFIEKDNIIINDRYTIVINQFTETLEARNFYETLNDFSNSETLFSQIQPGFIVGNINNIDNPKENVLGLFQVSSFLSERIFFNYRDFFSNNQPVNYFIDCTRVSPPIIPTNATLISFLNDGFLLDGFTGENNGNVGPFFIVPGACGDCTQIGDNIVPDFWKD